VADAKPSTIPAPIITITALMQRFGVGETNSTLAASTNAQPFRILDYAQTASLASARLAPAARRRTDPP